MVFVKCCMPLHGFVESFLSECLALSQLELMKYLAYFNGALRSSNCFSGVVFYHCTALLHVIIFQKKEKNFPEFGMAFCKK